MLMFIFGAGASYDSDPSRPVSGSTSPEDRHRPPLATQLFDPMSALGREAVAAFPRAAPVLMRLRQATAAGRDVEKELERLQAEEGRYGETASQLLSLRSYLAQLMTDLPNAWLSECQGRSNYVLALDEAARWNAAMTGENLPVACITLNYDTLLEEAVKSVWGIGFGDIESYTRSRKIKVFKPHGSVNWRQRAQWRPGAYYLGKNALHRAIELASELRWEDEVIVGQPETYHASGETDVALLPALSIPVQRKSDFMMPAGHLDELRKTLEQVTTVVAVGWRARERHLVKLLMDTMPSKPGRLIVVAESEPSVTETMENLWATGRFEYYCLSTEGFTQFARTYSSPEIDPPRSPTLSQILQGSAVDWIRRHPGAGMRHAEDASDYPLTAYSEL